MSVRQLRCRFISSYVIALLLIALSSGIAHWATLYTVSIHDKTAEVVNISGKQRMLLQRSFALAESSLGTRKDGTHLARLSETMAELLSANTHLLDYSKTSVRSKEIEFQLSRVFSNPQTGINVLLLEYQDIIQAVLDGKASVLDHERLEELALGTLFLRLDRAVQLFQEDIELGLVEIRNIQLTHFAFIILILIGEALFIFSPLLSKTLNALAAEQKAHRITQEAIELHSESHPESNKFTDLFQIYFLAPLSKAINKLEYTSEIDPDLTPDIVEGVLDSLKEVDLRARELARVYKNNSPDQ